MRDDKLIEAMAKLERMHSYDLDGSDPLAASALRQWAGEARDAIAVVQREGWVKCSARLPDERYDHNGAEPRLFWVTDGGNCISAWFVHELGMFGANGGMFTKVTHWWEQPLAAAPQPEEAP